MKIWILLLITYSCAQAPQKKLPLPFSILDTQVNKCLRYKKEVLDLAFDSRPEVAQNTLEKFDLKAGFKEEKEQLISGILSSCDEERVKRFQHNYNQISRCELGFSELSFFQLAVEKMRKRQWPLEMDLEAKRLALEYVTFYSTSKNYPLLDRLIALSILDELSAYSIVPLELHNDLKAILIESQEFIKKLEQINKSKQISCDNLKIMEEEIKYSQSVGEKLRKLLQKI